MKYDDPLQCVPCAGEKFIKPLSVVLEKWIRCGRDTRPGSSAGRRQEMIQFQSQAVPNISIYDYLRRLAENFQCSSECFVLALIYMDRVIKTNPSCVINEYNIHRLLVTAVMLAVKFFDDLYYTNQYYAHIGGVETAEINELEENFLHLIYWRLMVTPEEYKEYLDDVYSTPWTESQMISQPRSIRNGPAAQGSAPPARDRAETGEHAGRSRVDHGSVVGAHAAHEIRRPHATANMAHATSAAAHELHDTANAASRQQDVNNSTGRPEKYVPPGARGSNNRWRQTTASSEGACGVAGSQASMQTRFPTQQPPTSSSGMPTGSANGYRQFPFYDAPSKRNGGVGHAAGGGANPKWRCDETNGSTLNPVDGVMKPEPKSKACTKKAAFTPPRADGEFGYGHTNNGYNTTTNMGFENRNNNGQGSTYSCANNSQRKSQHSNNTTNSRFHKKKSQQSQHYSKQQHLRYTPVGVPFQKPDENVGPSSTSVLLSSIPDDSQYVSPLNPVGQGQGGAAYGGANNFSFAHMQTASTTIGTMDSPVCTIQHLESMTTIITRTWAPEPSVGDSMTMSHYPRFKQCHSNLIVPSEAADEKAARVECAENLKRLYSASTICSDGNSHYSTASSDHNEAQETVANLSS